MFCCINIADSCTISRAIVAAHHGMHLTSVLGQVIEGERRKQVIPARTVVPDSAHSFACTIIFRRRERERKNSTSKRRMASSTIRARLCLFVRLHLNTRQSGRLRSIYLCAGTSYPICEYIYIYLVLPNSGYCTFLPSSSSPRFWQRESAFLDDGCDVVVVCTARIEQRSFVVFLRRTRRKSVDPSV